MFKRAIPAIFIAAMACFSAFDMAAAQESQVIHFQGLLTGPDGGPLRTDIYDVNFSIWDQESGGVEPIWSELQVVDVTEGLFDVFLGSVNALSADVFTHAEGESELRYLEIQVVGDEPMTPRTQIAKTPNSFVSSRVLGDIVTGPGSFRMVHPPEGPDPVTAVEIDVDAARTSFSLMDPGDDKVGFHVFSGGEGNSIKMMDPSDDEVPVAEISTDGFTTSMKLIDPSDDEIGFDVFIGGEGNSMKLMDPSDDENSLIEMNGGIGGDASFKMFNPQPEPPAVLMEMSSSPSIGGSFRMFNPQPEPPAEPLLEMNTTQYSANLAMAAPSTGGLRSEITNPLFEVYVDTSRSSVQLMDPADPEIVGLELVVDSSGPKFRARFPQIPGQDVGLEVMTSSIGPAGDQVSLRMFNPQPEPPAVVTSMVSNAEGASLSMYAPIPEGQGDVMFDVFIDAQGASLSLSDEIGKYMGLEPTPFEPGGAFKMFDPESDVANLELHCTADGAGINLNDEIGKYMGIEPSPFLDGGYLKMYDPGTGDPTVSLGSDGAIQAKKATFGSSSNDGSYNLVVGMGNQASGDYNFVGGYQARSDYNNCFLWADYSTYQPLASSAANQFKVRSSGGIFLYTSGDMSSGVYLEPGASVWAPISAIPDLRNVRDVDGADILNKIRKLPVKRYRYESDEESAEHIGPVAGDFNELFGFSGEDAYISMRDESGVALAGVKALIEKIEQLEARIAELEAERR